MIRLGVTSPPWSKEAAGTGPLDGRAVRRTATRAPAPARAEGGGAWPSTASPSANGLQAVQGGRQEAREAVLPVRDAPRHDHVARRRGRDHRARGDLEVHDAIHRVDHAETPDQSGWLGKLYDEPADPGTISFVPRPDWYFYFLFYLLRIFKWPESVFLGTIGIPTIVLVLLIALPFIDVRRASGRPLQRPVAMVGGVLVDHLDGHAHLEGRDREGVARLRGARRRCRSGRRSRASRTTRPAIAGAKLFAQIGCLNCHTYLGAGGSNLGAPDLSAEGAKGQRRSASRSPT